MTSSARPPVGPYPIARWPRLSLSQAHLLTWASQTLPGAPEQAASAVLLSLLGARAELLGASLVAGSAGGARWVAIDLDGGARLRVEVPTPVAAWIVDRALGSESRLADVVGPSTVEGDVAAGVAAGVVGYVCARLLAALPGGFVVTDVHPDAPSTDGTGPTLALTLRLDGVDVMLRVVLRDVTTLSLPPTASTTTVPKRLALWRGLPLSLCAELPRPIRLTAGTLAALRIDDTVVVDTCTLTAAVDGGYAGQLRVRVPGATRETWMADAAGCRLELKERDTMTDAPDTSTQQHPALSNDALEPVADVPIDLSVELARFTVTLGELTTLVAGQVLLTGRPIGENVTLRAGNRAVARGELVSVDGSIGVRITAITGG